MLLTDRYIGGDLKDAQLKTLFETNTLKMSRVSETYKQQILGSKECLKVMVDHLGDIIQTPTKTKYHNQMLELVITFFRNLISLGSYESTYRRHQ